MKNDFKRLKRMLDIEGVDDNIESFVEVDIPEDLAGLEREAERMLNDPVRFIVNINPIEFGKNSIPVLMSLSKGVETIVINAPMMIAESSIVKVISAIDLYNHILDGNLHMIQLAIDNYNMDKGLLMAMTYKAKELKPSYIPVHYYPNEIGFRKGIIILSDNVYSNIDNIIPFDYQGIMEVDKSSIIGIEATYDYCKYRKYWEMCTSMGYTGKLRTLQVLNIHNPQHSSLIKKYMNNPPDLSVKLHGAGKYLFVVNYNNRRVKLVMADSNFNPVRSHTLPISVNSKDHEYLCDIMMNFFGTSGHCEYVKLIVDSGVPEYVVNYIRFKILHDEGSAFIDKVNITPDIHNVEYYLDNLIKCGNMHAYIYNKAIMAYCRNGVISPELKFLMLLSMCISNVGFEYHTQSTLSLDIPKVDENSYINTRQSSNISISKEEANKSTLKIYPSIYLDTSLSELKPHIYTNMTVGKYKLEFLKNIHEDNMVLKPYVGKIVDIYINTQNEEFIVIYNGQVIEKF